MNKEDLIKIFKMAKDQSCDVAIELTVPTREESEIIIVKNGNLDYKLDYYLKSYNDNLELERCTDVKILNATLFVWDSITTLNVEEVEEW